MSDRDKKYVKEIIGLSVGIVLMLLGKRHVNIGFWPWQKGYWK